MNTVVTVNYNTYDFIELLVYALSKLSFFETTILIADNGSNLDDLRKLKELEMKHDNIRVFELNHGFTGSFAHGFALNFLIAKVKTTIFTVLDSDAIFLVKFWDKLLHKQLNHKVKVVGTQGAENRKQDFPLLYGCMFETKTFTDLKIDMTPSDISKGQDTGWEVREKYLVNGYEGLNLIYKNTKYYKNGPLNNVNCGEYYFSNIPSITDIVASHFYRGATLGAQKYRRGVMGYIYRIPVIGRKMLIAKGKSEKDIWIEICREIVDSQLTQLKKV